MLNIWSSRRQFFLFQLRSARVFGAVFAVGSVLITISNLPWLLKADTETQVLNFGAAAAFFAFGVVMHIIASKGLRWYLSRIG